MDAKVSAEMINFPLIKTRNSEIWTLEETSYPHLNWCKWCRYRCLKI